MKVTTAEELSLAIKRVDELLSANPDITPSSPEGEEVESLIQAILRYESEE